MDDTMVGVMFVDETIVKKAYEIIGDLTPLHQDCGRLCDAACCRPDEDGDGGMFLFPGEEVLIKDTKWCKILPQGEFFAPIAVCEGTCDRDARPLACRIFPLTPAFVDGVLKVRMDARARALCPLAQSGVRGVRTEFARAALRALRLIAEDPEGAEFLKSWQALEEQFRNFRL